MPTQAINPGVVNRMQREDLAEIFLAPTPYPTRKGNIPWLNITPTGMERLRSHGWQPQDIALPAIGAEKQGGPP
jgi:hypothetical protein